MTDSITPPPELVQQLCGNPRLTWLERLHLAYQAGADQELEACCKWLAARDLRSQSVAPCLLRIARRPKPPSLKEQALGALSRADKDALTNPLTGEVVALRTILNKEQSDTIRRALGELPDN